jgi:hypothetical protein
MLTYWLCTLALVTRSITLAMTYKATSAGATTVYLQLWNPLDRMYTSETCMHKVVDIGYRV